jgi:hypothetical protein
MRSNEQVEEPALGRRRKLFSLASKREEEYMDSAQTI